MYEEMKPCEASPDCLHVPCEHCGVLIRTSSAKAGDHPGTRAGKLKTSQCGPCERRGGPPVQTVPDACVICEKPFRPRSETLADHPGTVRHEGLGRCVSCYRHERREETAAYHRETHRLKRQKQFEASENKIRDERHILLSDAEMLHIMVNHPKQFHWHAQRRKRLKLGEYS